MWIENYLQKNIPEAEPHTLIWNAPQNTYLREKSKDQTVCVIYYYLYDKRDMYILISLDRYEEPNIRGHLYTEKPEEGRLEMGRRYNLPRFCFFLPCDCRL